MSKFTLLCVIIAVCYIQYSHANSVSSVLVTDDLPSINFTALDSLSADKTLFITTGNSSRITVDGSNAEHDGIDNYYKWLSFLKSSTEAYTANTTEHSKTILINEKN